MIRIAGLLLITLFSLNTAQAGIPIKEEKTCPIGGEKFETTSTASCTTFGWTMSLSRISSCDFVTDLPICPGNGFPVYKKFNETDIQSIKTFMQTPIYKSAQKLSPYYLAWAIENHLDSKNHELKSQILVRGLSKDPRNTITSKQYLDQLSIELAGTIETIDKDNRSFLKALRAYVLVRNGQTQAAKDILDLLKRDKKLPAHGYLLAYIRSIELCLADNSSKYCKPDTAIPEK